MYNTSPRQVLSQAGISESKIQEALRVLEELGYLPIIRDMKPINSGMTNRLFYFASGGGEYLLRIPGEGSEHLVDRWQEHWIYHKLEGRNITEPLVYLNPDTGLKITHYIGNARCCSTDNMDEVRRCIRHLAHFHSQNLQGEVYFDLFEKLDSYERFCGHSITSIFPDYAAVRQKVMALKQVIEASPRSFCICHVDPVPDNFLLQGDKIYLIDWEYAAMADPHMDIAMFCIYAGYRKEQIDQVIDFYFKEGCSPAIRRKIYAYVACSGLLWTVWCEIKRDSGVLFEEYEQVQYRYATDFYNLVMEMEGLQ